MYHAPSCSLKYAQGCHTWTTETTCRADNHFGRIWGTSLVNFATTCNDDTSCNDDHHDSHPCAGSSDKLQRKRLCHAPKIQATRLHPRAGPPPPIQEERTPLELHHQCPRKRHHSKHQPPRRMACTWDSAQIAYWSTHDVLNSATKGRDGTCHTGLRPCIRFSSKRTYMAENNGVDGQLILSREHKPEAN